MSQGKHGNHTHDNYNSHTHGNHTHDNHTHDNHAHNDHKEKDAQKEHLHTHDHSHTHTKSVLNRLSRAIGHLTGVRNMVEEGRDCAEVLIQLAAVRAAINKICEIIMKDHLEHCIVHAVETDNHEALDELKRAIELLMK